MPATPPVQMRIPPDLLRRVDAAATGAGMSRTAWAVRAFESRLALEEGIPPVIVKVDPRMMDDMRAMEITEGRKAKRDGCDHPIARRLGPNCALCGAKVGKP